MFGFLAPRHRVPEWRRSYARICQTQRRLFGLTSLPFLSYEAAFLYQLAVDLQLLPQLQPDAPECCRLRRQRRTDPQHDKKAASFAAAFSLMLAGVKLDDDVADSGRWLNRFLAWKYRPQVRGACELLDAYAPSVTGQVAAAIKTHHVMEFDDAAVSIDDYSNPAGDGFAAVFEGFVDAISESTNSEVRAVFSKVGHSIGKAIIAWDCAVDFEKDRINGEFNPLQNETDVQRSFELCLMQLARVGWAVPEGGICQQVAGSVADRVRARRTVSSAKHVVRRLERWGFVRERGFEYARCDGCEAICALGECAGGAGGAGEAAAGCGDCGTCCAPDLCHCCFPCHDHNGPCSDSKKKGRSDRNEAQTTKTPYADYIGKNGITDSELVPSGFILSEGIRMPARSLSGEYISAGTPVEIVGADPFGVSVTRSSES